MALVVNTQVRKYQFSQPYVNGSHSSIWLVADKSTVIGKSTVINKSTVFGKSTMIGESTP
jgi:hypothetical protein